MARVSDVDHVGDGPWFSLACRGEVDWVWGRVEREDDEEGERREDEEECGRVCSIASVVKEVRIIISGEGFRC